MTYVMILELVVFSRTWSWPQRMVMSLVFLLHPAPWYALPCTTTRS